jgi:hypothetical protein
MKIIMLLSPMNRCPGAFFSFLFPVLRFAGPGRLPLAPLAHPSLPPSPCTQAFGSEAQARRGEARGEGSFFFTELTANTPDDSMNKLNLRVYFRSDHNVLPNPETVIQAIYRELASEESSRTPKGLPKRQQAGLRPSSAIPILLYESGHVFVMAAVTDKNPLRLAPAAAPQASLIAAMEH